MLVNIKNSRFKLQVSKSYKNGNLSVGKFNQQEFKMNYEYGKFNHQASKLKNVKFNLQRYEKFTLTLCCFKLTMNSYIFFRFSIPP